MSDWIHARSVDLEWRLVDDEVVLLDMRTQRYLSLNRTAAKLWPLIVDGVTRPELVAAILNDLGIDEKVARADIDVLIEQLRDADLLQVG